MSQRSFVFACWICSFLLFGTAVLGVSAQEEKLKELRGTVRHMDVKTGVLTFMPQGGDKLVELSLTAKELPITNPLGQPLKLTDLREEMRITVKLRNDEEVVAIRIEGPYQYGVIRSVDPMKRRLVFNDAFLDKTMTLPADVKILVDGKESSLDRCKVGDPIQILSALDRKTILQVQVGKGVNMREPYRRLFRSVGIVMDMDAAKRRVQIYAQLYDQGIIKSYELAPDVSIRLMYQYKPLHEVGLDQFHKWIKVSYVVDRETGKIAHLDADLPVMVRRKVVRVEPAKNKIIVEEEGREVSLDLAPDVKVFTARGEGKLADIAAKRVVNCGLTLDRSQVLLLFLWDN